MNPHMFAQAIGGQRQVIASRTHGHIAFSQARPEHYTIILNSAAAGDMHPAYDLIDRGLVDALSHKDGKTALAVMIAVEHFDHRFGIAAAALLAAAFLPPKKSYIRRIIIE